MQAIFSRGLLFVLLAAALGGCVYRMNIQQGNYLEAKTIDQVQTGMTRTQVRYLLGTPMVPDAFDNSRWDYVYFLRKGRLQAPQKRHVIVRFADDKVTQIDRAEIPSNSTLPLPDAERPPPSREDIPPSDPRSVQPRNPGASQPGAPQPTPAPVPKAEPNPPEDTSKSDDSKAAEEPSQPLPAPEPQPDPGP